MRNPSAADLYVGRRVYYCGTVYHVEWCDGKTVSIVVPNQQSTMLYQPYPGSYTNFSRWEVPVNSQSLFVEDEQGLQLRTSSTHQWRAGDIIRVDLPNSRFHNLEGVVTDSYVACGKTWVQANFDDLSLEFCDTRSVKPPAYRNITLVSTDAEAA